MSLVDIRLCYSCKNFNYICKFRITPKDSKCDKYEKFITLSDRQKTELIKNTLLSYWRIRRKYNYVCTELWSGNCDVFADNGKSKQYEIEIKVSKSDLKKEFSGKSWIKKCKHKDSEDGRKQYFYLCVTPELKEEAEKLLREYPRYGLMVVHVENVGHYNDKVEIIRKPKKLKEYDPELKNEAVRRMSNEILSLRTKVVSKLSLRTKVVSKLLEDDNKGSLDYYGRIILKEN